MLIKFGVDVNSLIEASSSRDDYKKHMDIIKLWGKSGILIIPGKDHSSSRLIAEINKLPQAQKTLWQQGLRNFRSVCLNTSFFEKIHSLEKATNIPNPNDMNVLSLSQTNASMVWCIPESNFSQTVNSLELCRFGDESLTTNFIKANEKQIKPIPPKLSNTEVWINYFNKISEHSQNIIIVDRYALQNHVKLRSKSGIFFFSKKISEIAKYKKNINLYTTLPINFQNSDTSFATYFENTINSIVKDFDALQNKNICLTIYAFDEHQYGDKFHCRYFRFDDKHLMLVDTGLEPLSNLKNKRLCPISILPWICADPLYKSTESDLKSIRPMMQYTIINT